MKKLIKASNENNYITERNKLDWLWLSVVFMFSINLFSKLVYLVLAMFLSGILIIIYKKTAFKFTYDFLLILLFSFSYSCIIALYKPSIANIILYLVAPIGSFFIGYSILKFEYKFLIKTIFAIVSGNFAHGFFNMVNYIANYGIDSLMRRVPDVWTGVGIAATVQGSYFTLVSSLLFYSFLLKSQKNNLRAFILLMAIMFSVFSSIVLGNRTLILIMLIIFFVNIIMNGYIMKNNRKRTMIIFILVVMVSLAIGLLYSKDLFGVKNFILNSELNSRIETTTLGKDPRISAYKAALSQMFDYPLGGYKMNLGLLYAHNLWLDVLFATGLIPFFFLILYTVKCIQNILKIIGNKYVDFQFKIIIVSIFLAYFLNFMVEPILEGMPDMFILFCLLNGMSRKYLDVCKAD